MSNVCPDVRCSMLVVSGKEQDVSFKRFAGLGNDVESFSPKIARDYSVFPRPLCHCLAKVVGENGNPVKDGYRWNVADVPVFRYVLGETLCTVSAGNIIPKWESITEEAP